jgi:hypothetical protein
VAEHRPYRPPHASSGDLRRIKAFAGTAIALAFVATNSVATQHAAAMLAHSTYLGSEFIRLPRIGRLYLPWEWLVWAARWHSVPQLWPIWVNCLLTAVYPMALIAPAAIGVIAIMRGDVFGRRADLHGSARWASSRNVRGAGSCRNARLLGIWVVISCAFDLKHIALESIWLAGRVARAFVSSAIRAPATCWSLLRLAAEKAPESSYPLF